jgi:hypothetical protein
MIHKIARRILIVAFSVLPIAALAMQQGAEAWYGRLSAKPKDFEPMTAFPGSFQIDVPKDWQLVPGYSGTIFMLAEKTKRGQPGGAIVLEHMQLQAAVEPSILPSLAAELLKDVQRRDSAGTGFTQEVITSGGRSLILIQYDRRGLSTGQDHVVQYSIPQGTKMYHLICIAPRDAIDRYRPIFAYTAASFIPVSTGS